MYGLGILLRDDLRRVDALAVLVATGKSERLTGRPTTNLLLLVVTVGCRHCGGAVVAREVKHLVTPRVRRSRRRRKRDGEERRGKGVGAQRGGDVAGVGVGNEGQHLWPCGGLRKVGRFDDGRDVIEVRRPRVAVLELIWTDSVPPLWYEPNRRQLMREENVHATARLVEDCGLVLAVLVAISRGGVRA